MWSIAIEFEPPDTAIKLGESFCVLQCRTRLFLNLCVILYLKQSKQLGSFLILIVALYSRHLKQILPLISLLSSCGASFVLQHFEGSAAQALVVVS